MFIPEIGSEQRVVSICSQSGTKYCPESNLAISFHDNWSCM